MRVAASCVAFDGRGLLILGGPGSGKSTLVADCMAAGAELVADDQVLIREDGEYRASPPPTIAGKLALRGLGLFDVPYRAEAVLVAAVSLSGNYRGVGNWRHGECILPCWSAPVIHAGVAKLWLKSVDPVDDSVTRLPEDWFAVARAG